MVPLKDAGFLSSPFPLHTTRTRRTRTYKRKPPNLYTVILLCFSAVPLVCVMVGVVAMVMVMVAAAGVMAVASAVARLHPGTDRTGVVRAGLDGQSRRACRGSACGYCPRGRRSSRVWYGRGRAAAAAGGARATPPPPSTVDSAPGRAGSGPGRDPSPRAVASSPDTPCRGCTRGTLHSS